jgi:hypothetical protein
MYLKMYYSSFPQKKLKSLTMTKNGLLKLYKHLVSTKDSSIKYAKTPKIQTKKIL